MPPAAPEPDSRSTILATGQRIMSRKGFSAVGLTEILKDAGVPKGSFYHYFASKDAFGEAMLSAYFEDYHGDMDVLFAKPGLTAAERFDYSYSKAELGEWLAPIRRLADEANEVHLLMNNCYADKAVRNAAELSELLRPGAGSATT